MLLDQTEDGVEVFCEHHEDVLLKHSDGKFTGLQVKTRASDQEVWKTSDDGIRGSCARFAKLEAAFPGRFRGFRFLTNHPLWTARNGQDFRWVLGMIKEALSVRDLSGTVASFLARLAREAGCSPEAAFAALSRTDACDDLPKLADIEVRLVDALTAVWSRAADLSYRSVTRAAGRLASECGRASSLAHHDVLPAYLPATTDPAGIELAARLSGKRFDVSRVRNVLDEGINEMAPLEADPATFVEPGTGATDLLLKKLDAGGFSAVSRNSAEDLRNKADYLGLVWINKHGRQGGLQRYTHVRSLVLSDAARAFEATKTDQNSFGLQMLAELRSRFQERRMEGSQMYECSNEHLEGFAYSLTSECRVYWSLDRPWEER
jgi:hypothetical protein